MRPLLPKLILPFESDGKSMLGIKSSVIPDMLFNALKLDITSVLFICKLPAPALVPPELSGLILRFHEKLQMGSLHDLMFLCRVIEILIDCLLHKN